MNHLTDEQHGQKGATPDAVHAPLAGKTYSLYDGNIITDAYYERIRLFAEESLQTDHDIDTLLSTVRGMSSNKRRLKKLSASKGDSSEARLLFTLRDKFSSYTKNASSHLRGLSFREKFDKTLSASEEQYFLYMLEIELVNRANVTAFRRCEMKLAFLPHCLRDLSAVCRSTNRGIDYVCKGCSKDCSINRISKLLRRHGVKPYIWMAANLRSLFKQLRKEGKTPGVLGIACIRELVNGIRMCARAQVPVTGIPLDANRCGRWWGEFYRNSVNINQLELLLGEETRISPKRSQRMYHV